MTKISTSIASNANVPCGTGAALSRIRDFEISGYSWGKDGYFADMRFMLNAFYRMRDIAIETEQLKGYLPQPDIQATAYIDKKFEESMDKLP